MIKMSLKQKKDYVRPSVELFSVEQKLSYLAYFSGVGSIDQWEMEEEELKFERVD